MDITAFFKACVKTVRTTNKTLGIKDQNHVFNKTFTRKDKYLENAKTIAKKIVNLYSILQTNKSAYLNMVMFSSTRRSMTEVDRQQIDSLVEEIINQCRHLISEYKQEIADMKGEQKRTHYENILEMLNMYLRDISTIYAERKAIHVKRVIDTHNLSKLETGHAKNLPLKNNLSNKPDNQSQIPSRSLNPNDADIELSHEDIQIFESENELLYNDLNSLSDEVKQVEQKVVHIAELQEVFTKKILQQDKEIEKITTKVVSSTEHMKDANEQIRQAIQRNAGLRVWILFFLIVMSFSLLFLDWYND